MTICVPNKCKRHSIYSLYMFNHVSHCYFNDMGEYPCKGSAFRLTELVLIGKGVYRRRNSGLGMIAFMNFESEY